MARLPKNQTLCAQIGPRLVHLMDDLLAISEAKLAAEVGLGTVCSVRNARAGKGVLDTDRLVRLSTIQTADGRVPNLHWLLTGQGPALLPPVAPSQDGLTVWLTPSRIEALKTLSEAPLTVAGQDN